MVVAGDALVDLIVRPDGGITAVPGGSQYNTVRAIGRLGIACSFVGGISSDRFGRMLEAGLTGDGVDVAMVQRTTRPTTLALAELGADGSAAYHFYIEGTSGPAVLPGPLDTGLPPSVAALCAGSLGFVLEPVATTLEWLVAGLPERTLFMLDPNARPSITSRPRCLACPDATPVRACGHREGQHGGPGVHASRDAARGDRCLDHGRRDHP